MLTDVFADVCAQSSIDHVPLYVDDPNDPFHSDPERYYAYDGVHPNDEGYGVVYKNKNSLHRISNNGILHFTIMELLQTLLERVSAMSEYELLYYTFHILILYIVFSAILMIIRLGMNKSLALMSKPFTSSEMSDKKSSFLGTVLLLGLAHRHQKTLLREGWQKIILAHKL